LKELCVDWGHREMGKWKTVGAAADGKLFMADASTRI